MKNTVKGIISLIAVIVMVSCRPIIYTTSAPQTPPPQVVIAPPPQPEYGPQTTYQVFYDELGPYGSWVEYPPYGYVWVPRLGSQFEPYSTGGHWIYTDNGWSWFSEYSWGWAPFHYGRWFFDDYHGWLWIPGNEWAPAWVTWGYYNDYYCWAPVGPGVSHYENYRPPHRYWHFVHSKNITENNVNNYVVNNTTIINNVTNITIINNTNTNNNITYNQGPKREEVERATQKKVMTVPVKESSKPVTAPKEAIKAMEKGDIPKEPIPVYKPDILKDNDIKNTQVRPAPKKLEKIENIQPVQKQPAQDKPVINQPVQDKRFQDKPVEKQPVIERPVQKQPVIERPVQKQPVIERPVKDKPVINQPVKRQSVKEQPAQKQSAPNQPVISPSKRKTKVEKEQKNIKQKDNIEQIKAKPVENMPKKE